jgi:hypothetical protein
MGPEPDQASVLCFHLLSMLYECHCAHRLLADGERIALCARLRTTQETHPHALVHFRRAAWRWQAKQEETN